MAKRHQVLPFVGDGSSQDLPPVWEGPTQNSPPLRGRVREGASYRRPGITHASDSMRDGAGLIARHEDVIGKHDWTSHKLRCSRESICSGGISTAVCPFCNPPLVEDSRADSAGVCPKPVHGGCGGLQDRDMSVAWGQPQLCRRAAASEPHTVRAGYHPVRATVQE